MFAMTRNPTVFIVAAAMALFVASGGTHAADKAAEKAAAPKISLDDRIAACAACHGKDGNGVATFPDYPKLAGQHQDYLVKALRDYKSGARKNAIMAGQAQDLSIGEMQALSRHFAGQAGPLHVVR
jgi:cytochrome c553